MNSYLENEISKAYANYIFCRFSLINVEEECVFLRQRCTDFETQLGRQRDEYDALLAKYNEVSAERLRYLIYLIVRKPKFLKVFLDKKKKK